VNVEQQDNCVTTASSYETMTDKRVSRQLVSGTSAVKHHLKTTTNLFYCSRTTRIIEKTLLLKSNAQTWNKTHRHFHLLSIYHRRLIFPLTPLTIIIYYAKWQHKYIIESLSPLLNAYFSNRHQLLTPMSSRFNTLRYIIHISFLPIVKIDI